MGGEWSKAVGMIFKQKYSNGRGKLQDAMKDPDTKVLHEQLKSGKKVKVGKTRKMRGGAGPQDGDEGESPVEEDNDESLEGRVAAIERRLTALEGIKQDGGFPAKSKKSRKVKSRRN
jgi:hypothetical protein